LPDFILAIVARSFSLYCQLIVIAILYRQRQQRRACFTASMKQSPLLELPTLCHTAASLAAASSASIIIDVTDQNGARSC